MFVTAGRTTQLRCDGLRNGEFRFVLIALRRPRPTSYVTSSWADRAISTQSGIHTPPAADIHVHSPLTRLVAYYHIRPPIHSDVLMPGRLEILNVCGTFNISYVDCRPSSARIIKRRH